MIVDSMYARVLKPVLFKIDPETVHHRMTQFGTLLGSASSTRSVIRSMFSFKHPALHTTVAGIHFENPVGLAAGFDKTCVLYDILPEVGFGFAELGSITGEPCAGNPRPRLFRVPAEKSIIVNYGLCNPGAEEVSQRLANVKFRIPIGFSVAKTNDPSLSTEEGIKDYCKAFRLMHPLGAYTTVNVSCPNTCDGQTFGHPENLKPLLAALSQEKHAKPVFLKIKPDLDEHALSEVLDIVEKHQWVTGFIVSNLTMNRTGLSTSKDALDDLSMKGGLSGLPVRDKSTKTIRFVRKKSDKIIIGVGGIVSGIDAYEKLKAGASLLQLVTGLIYEGPGVVAKINRELVELLHEDGFENVMHLRHD